MFLWIWEKVPLQLKELLNSIIFTHLKLCLGTAAHNFKWIKLPIIFLIQYQTFANPDV